MFKPNSGIAGASIVWGVSYVFFLFSLANNFSASHDSINYLNHIVKGDALFHQHHLLYHFIANGWLQLWGAVFPAVSEHYIVEAFTAFWGSSLLAMCFLFFRNRFGLLVPLAVAGVCAIGFSYGTWFYSVNVEVYSAPVFFVVTALYVMTGKNDGMGTIGCVAVLQSFAILFHQVNVLFTPVVVWWLWSNRKMISFGKSTSAYVLLSFIIAGGVYFFVGWFAEEKNTAALFADWLLGYTKTSHGYWQSISASTPLQVIAGFGRVFIGAHFIFQLPALSEILQSAFGSHNLHDEIFLSRNITPFNAWLLSALTLLFASVLIILVIKFIGSFRKMNVHQNVLRPIIFTLLVYSVFFIFWEPEVPDFWILQMVMVWLLLVGMLPVYRFPLRLSNTTGVGLLCVILFFVNCAGSLKPMKSFGNDWYYVEVTKITPGKNDLVIVEDQWILKDYVRYFTSANVIATDEQLMTRDEIVEVVQQTKAQNGKVYLYRGEWSLIQSY